MDFTTITLLFLTLGITSCTEKDVEELIEPQTQGNTNLAALIEGIYVGKITGAIR